MGGRSDGNKKKRANLTHKSKTTHGVTITAQSQYNTGLEVQGNKKYWQVFQQGEQIVLIVQDQKLTAFDD